MQACAVLYFQSVPNKDSSDKTFFHLTFSSSENSFNLIFSETISNAYIRKPPVPQKGSIILSPILGEKHSTTNSTTFRGVKYSPKPPVNVSPRKYSNASPFTSKLVRVKSNFSKNLTSSLMVLSLRSILVSGGNSSLKPLVFNIS